MNELIYNQRDIPRDKWRYGLRSSAAAGCGWIATHNALHLLGYREEIPDLIDYYEHQVPLVNGNLGTVAWGPALCFRRWGFPVTVHADPRTYDQAAAQADAAILFYHWHQNWKLGAHFIALRKEDRGFVGYNTYRTSVGPDLLGQSLQSFLSAHRYFPSLLICIGRRKPQ